MVTFGAPVTVDNPTTNAVNAALEINKIIDDKIEKKKFIHSLLVWEFIAEKQLPVI